MQIVVGPVRQQHRADVVSDELLKTLAEDGCQSNGPPVVQACDFIFLRYGHNGGFFEAWGNHRQREGQIEDVCKNPASW